MIIVVNLSSAQVCKDCLKKNTHQIKSIEPISDNSDLKIIGTYIGDNNVVSLGEATHGSREFFMVKHRLIKYLIEEKGFNIFAIESSMPETYKLNDYVLNGVGDPKMLLMRTGYWVWHTEEVLALINWIREYNKAHDKKVQFVGFDMQSYEVAFQNIKDNIFDTITEINQSIEKLNSLHQEIENNKLKGIYQMSDTSIDQLYHESKFLLEKMELIKKEKFPSITQDKFSWLVQNCTILSQYATSRSIYKPEKGYRDLCMANNINWIKQNNSNSKIIIWAHNGHVKRDTNTMGNNLVNMGISPYVIGFSTYAGTYTAISEGKFANNILQKPDTTCYEHFLNLADFDSYFIDLKTAVKDKNCRFLLEKLKFREIGSMKRDNQFYDSDLSFEYDAIINIRKTSNSNLLYEY